MKFSCKEFNKHIGNYLDGTLPEETRELLESHGEECEKCAETLQDEKTLVELLSRMEKVEAPDEIRQNVMKQIETQKTPQRPGRLISLFSYPALRYATEIAAVCIIFLVGIQILSKSDLFRKEIVEKAAMEEIASPVPTNGDAGTDMNLMGQEKPSPYEYDSTNGTVSMGTVFNSLKDSINGYVVSDQMLSNKTVSEREEGQMGILVPDITIGDKKVSEEEAVKNGSEEVTSQEKQYMFFTPRGGASEKMREKEEGITGKIEARGFLDSLQEVKSPVTGEKKELKDGYMELLDQRAVPESRVGGIQGKEEVVREEKPLEERFIETAPQIMQPEATEKEKTEKFRGPEKTFEFDRPTGESEAWKYNEEAKTTENERAAGVQWKGQKRDSSVPERTPAVFGSDHGVFGSGAAERERREKRLRSVDEEENLTRERVVKGGTGRIRSEEKDEEDRKRQASPSLSFEKEPGRSLGLFEQREIRTYVRDRSRDQSIPTDVPSKSSRLERKTTPSPKPVTIETFLTPDLMKRYKASRETIPQAGSYRGSDALRWRNEGDADTVRSLPELKHKTSGSKGLEAVVVLSSKEVKDFLRDLRKRATEKGYSVSSSSETLSDKPSMTKLSLTFRPK